MIDFWRLILTLTSALILNQPCTLKRHQLAYETLFFLHRMKKDWKCKHNCPRNLSNLSMHAHMHTQTHYRAHAVPMIIPLEGSSAQDIALGQNKSRKY